MTKTMKEILTADCDSLEEAIMQAELGLKKFKRDAESQISNEEARIAALKSDLEARKASLGE